MKVKTSTDEIRKYLDINGLDLPKYTSPLIILANRFSQGTRPKVVGQMSDLIQEFSGKSLPEWKRWYLEKNPNAIQNATEKILLKLNDLKTAINIIDNKMIEK